MIKQSKEKSHEALFDILIYSFIYLLLIYL